MLDRHLSRSGKKMSCFEVLTMPDMKVGKSSGADLNPFSDDHAVEKNSTKTQSPTRNASQFERLSSGRRPPPPPPRTRAAEGGEDGAQTLRTPPPPPPPRRSALSKLTEGASTATDVGLTAQSVLSEGKNILGTEAKKAMLQADAAAQVSLTEAAGKASRAMEWASMVASIMNKGMSNASKAASGQ
jgi:hypothetical protein